MSLVSSAPAFVARNSRSGSYQIEQSLRFDGSSYMTRTPASNGSLSTWTYSTWIKYGDVAGSIVNTLISTKATVTPYGQLLIRADQELGFYQRNSGNTDSSWQKYSSNKLRDPSAWYHFLFVLNTGDSTVNNRQRMWINGVEVTSFSSDYKPGSADNSAINSTQEHMIGAYRSSSIAGYMKGYMAETHFVDGTALDPTDFGEYDVSGVWRPIRYTGTYGTNGFYLTFDPSATNGIGHDHSGNGNHFTSTGFVTTGTGTDVMSDTPTMNWCTVNPLSQRQYLTTSNGNLQINYNNASNGVSIVGTQGASSGKWYWETTMTTASGADYVGVVTSDWDVMGRAGVAYPGSQNNGWTYYRDGRIYHNGSFSSYGDSYTTGDVIGLALDLNNGKIYFSKNGTFQNSSNPSTEANPAFSNVSGTVFPVWAGYNTSTVHTCNFGQRDFAYTPPTGFKALNTSNLPAPGIKDGSKYFDAVRYSGATSGTAGAGTTQSVTGLGFSPDFVWIKNRTNANSHGLFDQVRGAVNVLRSDLTNAEATTNSSGALSAFDSNGFTLANGSSGSDQAILTHQTGYNYIAWAWDAGGSGSSNTDGSITSTVSANATAGFSIVSYTGTASAATLGHGLGVKPSMILIKNRDQADKWAVYHSSVGATKFLSLNETSTATTSSAYFNDTEPTSSVFTVNQTGPVNQNGEKYIAYCFAEVENYSKFSSYTGNGSTDGPFVYCGFKPAFLVVKRTDTTGNWPMVDAARDPDNVVETGVFANDALSESTFGSPLAMCDFLSNGFKVRIVNTNWNASGGTYIFAAFAENPFGGFGVSPATAR